MRVYWRLTRPTRWLFSGRDGERPLEPTVLHAACRSARIAAGLSKHVKVHTLRQGRHRVPDSGARRPCRAMREGVRKNV
ncbi:hypothetical protein [Bradyrhizobium sp. 200]|uniref:hypothetical protein n=1 Tax=Bradyrhizobium sp. 200 TaxID=2782665 RepID=UPI00320A4F1C